MRRAAVAWVVAALALAVLGLVPYGAWSIRTGKLALLEIGLLCVAALAIRPRAFRWILYLALLGFCLHYNSRSAVTCWRLLMAAMGIEVIAASLSVKQLPAILLGFRVITLLHTGYMLLQLMGIDPFFVSIPQIEATATTGLMDNRMLSGAYTAMTLPLFMAPRWRWALGLSLLAVLSTKSLGAVVVASILLVWMIGASRWVVWLAVGCVALGWLSVTEPIGAKLREEMRGGRFAVWRMGLGMMRHAHPMRWVFGVGPGQYAPEIRRYHAQTEYRNRIWMPWSRAHNEPLQAFQEFGLIGLLLWLACVGRWLRAGWEAWEPEIKIVLMIAVGWVLCSLYVFTGHVAPLAVVAIVVAGVLEGARRQREGAYVV